MRSHCALVEPRPGRPVRVRGYIVHACSVTAVLTRTAGRYRFAYITRSRDSARAPAGRSRWGGLCALRLRAGPDQARSWGRRRRTVRRIRLGAGGVAVEELKREIGEKQALVGMDRSIGQHHSGGDAEQLFAPRRVLLAEAECG